MIHQVPGQPVEQSGVAGHPGALAKVTGSRHQASSKMMRPHAVHHDPGGERIAGRDDGLGEFKPATAFGKGWRRIPAHDFEKTPGNGIAFGEGIAPLEDPGRRWLGPVHQNRGMGRSVRGLDEPAVHLRLQFPQFLDDIGGKELLDIYNRFVRNGAGGMRAMEHAAQGLGPGVRQGLGGRFGFEEFAPLLLHGREEDAVTLGDFLHAGWRRDECLDHQRRRLLSGLEQQFRHHSRALRRERFRVQFRESKPRGENGVLPLFRLCEKLLPAAHKYRIDVSSVEDLAKRFFGVFFQFGLGLQMPGDGGPHAGRLLLTPQRQRGAQFVRARGQLLVESGVGRAGFTAGDQHLGTALEDPIERIVVADGDRIEFVIMAAGAGHRQGLGAAHHNINAIIDDVVGDAEKPFSEGKKSHRCQVWRTLRLHLIRGHLEQEKTVVGHVLIQRAHHPVAITPGVHELLFLAGIHITFGVGITGHIQPVARPVLSIMRRGQQTVHHLRESVRGRVLQKGLHRSVFRRQPGEVKRDAADQGPAVRRCRRLQTRLPQPLEDKAVHLLLTPRVAWQGGRLGMADRLKGPQAAPRRKVDP